MASDKIILGATPPDYGTFGTTGSTSTQHHVHDPATGTTIGSKTVPLTIYGAANGYLIMPYTYGGELMQFENCYLATDIEQLNTLISGLLTGLLDPVPNSLKAEAEAAKKAP